LTVDLLNAPWITIPFRLEDTAMQLATRCTAAVHAMLIRVYDAAGNVIETHKHKGDFTEP